MEGREDMKDVEHSKSAWIGQTFAEIVQGVKPPRILYTREGEEDPMGDFDLANIIQPQEVVGDLSTCPVVDILWKKY